MCLNSHPNGIEAEDKSQTSDLRAGRAMAEAEEMIGKGEDSMDRCGAGSDTGPVGIGDGEGDGGLGDAAHALGPPELPIVELGLLGAGGGEDDGVPGGDAGRVADGEAEAVP